MIRRYARSFAVMIAGISAGFLVHLGLARLLGASEYGIYSFIYALASVVAIFAVFGFETALARLIPTCFSSKKEEIWPLIRFSMAFTGILSAILAFLAFFILYIGGFSEKYPVFVLISGVFLVILIVCLRRHAGILRGLHQGTLSIFYELSFREFAMLPVVAAGLLGLWQIGRAQEALFALAAILLAGAILSGLHVRRKLRAEGILAQGSWQAGPEDKKNWLRTAFPMLLTMAAKRLLQRTDIIMLGVLVEPALVGAYGLAALFADAATLASRPTLAYFGPRAAALYQAGDMGGLRRNFLQATGFIAAINIGAAIVIALAAPYILPYFGAGFERAYLPLLILLGGAAVDALFSLAGNLLIMTAYERQVMRITMISAGLNIVLNPILIHYFSIEGAAISSAVIMAGWSVACFILALRKGLLRGV